MTIPIKSESDFAGVRTVNLGLSNPSAGTAVCLESTAILDIEGNGLSGGVVQLAGTVSSGGNTYEYTAVQDGVLRWGLDPTESTPFGGPTWTLTVADVHGNSSGSSGTEFQQVNLLAQVGEVYTITVSSTSPGSGFTVDVIDVFSRVHTAAGDVLQISGGGVPVNVGIGTSDLQAPGTGNPSDILISSPGMQGEITLCRVDPPAKAHCLERRFCSACRRSTS